MNSIINVSVRSELSPERKAITAVTAAAAIKSMVITSLNCDRSSFKKPVFLPFSSSFAPNFSRREPASEEVRPIGEEPSDFNACCALIL